MKKYKFLENLMRKSIFFWNCLINRNSSEICLEKSKFFVKLPEKIESFRKFALKNRFSVCEIPEKNQIFSKVFSKIEISLWNCLKNRNSSKICLEKFKIFVKVPVKIKIFRKFALKNRVFVCQVAWKNQNFF